MEAEEEEEQEEETCSPQMSTRNDAISEAFLGFASHRTICMIDEIDDVAQASRVFRV